MSDVIFANAQKFPKNIAISCKGTKIDYSKLYKKIVETAKAFAACGIKAGDKVTVCMPNLPQTVYALYALNYIGAVASMIHPLSAESEIAYYLNEVDSSVILTLDVFYPKMLEVQKLRKIERIIIPVLGLSFGSTGAFPFALKFCVGAPQ